MSDMLEVVRGLVRPISTWALVGAVIVLAFKGKVDTGELVTMASMALAFWFASRPPTSAGQG